MNSWTFLLKNLCPNLTANSGIRLVCQAIRQIFSQQIRSVFVFIILYLITLFPILPTNIDVASHLLILQGLCLINVLINIQPLIKEDVQDGFIERWLGNQGLEFRYYTIRQILIFFVISMPTATIAIILVPSLSFWEYGIFGACSLINMLIMALWASSISLLLASPQESGKSLVGMMLVALFLIPQLLIEQVIFETMLANIIAIAQVWLYVGLSIISIAFNLILAPTIVRLSVSH